MAVLARSDWSAGPQRAGVIRTPVSRHYLHHSVTPMWVGVAAARNLQRIARERGFVDISYNQLVDRAGNEIEGRGWGRQGAHTVGYNSSSHALCLVGNFESGFVPDAMIRGAARICRRHRRYGPGRITHPHSAVSSTACPGRNGRARIDTINLMASTGTPPPPTTKDWLDMATEAQVRKIVREEVSKLPSGLEILNGLIWASTNAPQTVGDLNSHVQKQLSLVLQAELNKLLAKLTERLEAQS